MQLEQLGRARMSWRAWLGGVLVLARGPRLPWVNARRIAFVGFQETLDRDFATAKTLLALPHEMQLPTDEVASHKTPSQFDKDISAEAIANVSEWYQDDYQILEFLKGTMVERGLRAPD